MEKNFNSDSKSFSSVHLRAIANDLSSDTIFSSFSFYFFVSKDEPFSDDDPFDYIDDDSDLLETPETMNENQLKSMGSVEISDVVNIVNQKIIQTSTKVTNMQNPIKVLVFCNFWNEK
jgi:hypothetical protein